MLASAASFSIVGVCVKFSVADIHPLQVVFFRSFFGLLIIWAILLKQKHSFFGKEKKLMILRGISGFLALVLHFYTIKHLELGIAITLNYMAPIFVAFFSTRFLSEKPSDSFYPLLACSFIGVAMMNIKNGLSWNPYIAIAILSAMFAAVAYLTIRGIHERESPYTVIFYFTAISTVGSLLFIPTWTWPSPVTWIYLVIIGIGSYYGQFWLTTAMRKAPAWLVSPFIYLNPVLSSIYGIIFFGEGGSLFFWIGLACVSASGILISLTGIQRKMSMPSKTTLPS
jgi:drug/metabolite transporter (DMT)-like permease